MQNQSCDILVIGSGIAGLSFALQCAHHFRQKKVVVLCKGTVEESNTRYAQGGIAAVMNNLHDSFDKHIEDTLVAGNGLCRPEIVNHVVRSAPRAIHKLINWGLEFDRRGKDLALGREGGHCTNRILHCKDHTGHSIVNTLLKQCKRSPNIELRENQFVWQLLNHQHRCKGAVVCTDEAVYCQRAHYTMLASGGAGQVYQLTSNPAIATGDGLALAQEVGATLKHMAFVQFHPTVLYQTEMKKPFLISEAVRGVGAILRNHDGNDFMPDYDTRGSLATRDVAARAIFSEMYTSGKPHVWLDVRHLNSRSFEMAFPTIAQRLATLGIDIQSDMIPVLPAAHYMCGGIVTDKWAQTSLPGLLACGEVAYTGLHGANRLASNSLLEAVVFAHQAYLKLADSFTETQLPKLSPPVWKPRCKSMATCELRSRLQKVMTAKVGIVRSENGLLEARELVWQMLKENSNNVSSIDEIEFKNMLRVSLAIIDDSLQRKENHGCFFREDLISAAG